MNRKGEKFFQLDLEEVEGEESERETGKEWWRRSRRGTGSQGMDVEMTEIGEEIEPSLQSEKNEEEENPQQEHTQEEQEQEEEERQRWNSRVQFFLATIGFAVGIGNVWRFPYLCYRNGGGAFLIPYFITLIVLALPLFTLELYLGNLCQRGPCSLFLRKIPKTVRFGGVGIASAVTSFFVVCYYNVILAWSLSFFVYSFQNPLPWDNNPDFFYDFVLQRSDSINETGGLVWQLTLALFIDCVIVFISVFQGVKWSGRVVMVTVTTPYILLIILFFKGITLDGAAQGLRFYLTPDFSRLGELDIWVAAAGQVFFSLSPAWGVAITFGSYLPLDEPIAKDAISIALINSATSIFAGFVIFSVLGHMSWETGIPVEDVAVGGPELAFIVYPTALSLLPYPYVFSVMFFAMMMLLGIDSAFAIVELLIASLQETKWLANWRKQFLAGIIVFFSFLGGLVLTTRAGIYWVDLIDHFVPLLSLFTIGLIELVCVAWWWPLDKFLKSLAANRGRKIPFEIVWYALWKFITPALLCVMIVMTLINEIKVQYGGYPPWAQLVGWIIAFIPPCVIALFFVLKKGRPMHKRTPKPPKRKKSKKIDSPSRSQNEEEMVEEERGSE